MMTMQYGKPLVDVNLEATPSAREQSLLNANILSLLGFGVRFIKGRFARHRSRQQLARLNDHQLQDIGITRKQALVEARESFWR